MSRLQLSDQHWSKLWEILLHKAIHNKRGSTDETPMPGLSPSLVYDDALRHRKTNVVLMDGWAARMFWYGSADSSRST